ncbi:MAG: HEAT repeat domain-containing protein [Myxococcaceae bacterium]
MLRSVCVLLAVGLFGATSLAQSSPRKGGVKLGSPKEEVDASGPTSSRDADLALLRGLLFALEPSPPEIRVQAMEDLALVGDPRALNLLAQLIFDGNPNVQLAAVKTVTKFQTPRAEEILCNVIRHPQVAEMLKVRAVEGLLFQRTASSLEMLEEVSKQPRYNSRLQTAARAALQDLQR